MNDFVRAEKEFTYWYPFTKEELVASFSGYMEYVATENETGITEAMRKKRLELCQLFFDKLQKSNLPVQNKGHLYYEYCFEDTSVDLNLCRASDLSWENDSFEMSSEVEHTLLSIECDMLSIDEYAELNEVTPATVQRWLKKGKIRSARMRDGEWVIPVLADRPRRGYEPALYVIDDPGSICIDEYPFVALSSMISVDQDEDDKELFHVLFINHAEGMRQRLDLIREDVEELERSLIATGKTTQAARIQFVPTIKKAD